MQNSIFQNYRHYYKYAPNKRESEHHCFTFTQAAEGQSCDMYILFSPFCSFLKHILISMKIAFIHLQSPSFPYMYCSIFILSPPFLVSQRTHTFLLKFLTFQWLIHAFEYLLLLHFKNGVLCAIHYTILLAILASISHAKYLV